MMCLIEVGVGFLVGDNCCKVVFFKDEEGVFLFEGEKIFISGGDSDLVENIMYLVLVWMLDLFEGIKGLSLFFVFKYDFDEEGNVGV